MTSFASVDAHVDRRPGRPDVVWLDNGSLRLGFVPDLGGRLLSARVGATETLWRNGALLDDELHPVGGHRPAPAGGELSEWLNYGGDKTWPAPQGWSGLGEWAGPPDPVLDSGPYEWALDDDPHKSTLTMTSGDDPRTGLRIRRRFTMTAGSTAYDLQLTATNRSEQPVTWSLWNVMQRRADSPGTRGVIVAAAPEVVSLIRGTGTPSWYVLSDSRVAVDHQRVVGKLGFPQAGGWLAHVSHGTTTTIQFTPESQRRYPDSGSRVELWMETPLERPLTHLGGLRPSDDIVELEVLGPLRRLQPGESMSLALRCAVTAGAHTDISRVARDGHQSEFGWTSYYRAGCASEPSPAAIKETTL